MEQKTNKAQAPLDEDLSNQPAPETTQWEEKTFDLQMVAEAADAIMGEAPQKQEKHTGGIRVRYYLDAHMIERALIFADRTYSFTKRVVFTVILGILSIFFTASHFVNTASFENRLFVAAVLAGFAVILWVMPYTIRKRKVKAAIELKDEPFILTVYNEGIGVGPDEDEAFFSFEEKGFKAREEAKYFLFDVGGEVLFALDKALLDDTQCAWISTRLEQTLGKKFFRK